MLQLVQQRYIEVFLHEDGLILVRLQWCAPLYGYLLSGAHIRKFASATCLDMQNLQLPEAHPCIYTVCGVI